MDTLTFEQFSELRQFSNGSLCDVLKGKLHSFNRSENSDGGIVCVIKTARADQLEKGTHHIRAEEAILRGLQHPNIITFFGSGLTPEGQPFICLEYLPNGTLDERCGTDEQGGPSFLYRLYARTFTASLQDAFLKIAPLAAGIAYLHDRRIIHRDIKPQNIMYAADETMKLLDFGLARRLPEKKGDKEEGETSGKTISGSGSFYRMTGGTGSQRFMANEVAMNQPYNETADVYSFGMVLWEYIALKKPFEYNTVDQWYEGVVKQGMRPAVDAGWPPLFIDLLERMWCADPTERPCMAEVHRCLLELGGATERSDGGGKDGDDKAEGEESEADGSGEESKEGGLDCTAAG